MKKPIFIKSIRVVEEKGLIFEVIINDKTENIEYTFSENVHQFVITDRCDAVVIGLLMLSIRLECNIKSVIPISNTLYYRLTNHFIPGICGKGVFQPSLEIPIINDYVSAENANIVATGISCGVDSLYTVMSHLDSVPDDFKITNLVYLTAGASHTSNNDLTYILNKSRKELSSHFCDEVHIPLIEIRSNLPEVIEKHYKYHHIEFHTYMMLSCILSIGRGVKKYYYSAGMSYSQFDCLLKPKEILCCAHYDLLILWAASNSQTQFYSTGGHLSRLQKVQSIVHYSPSKEYLNVCISSPTNCGHCFKCKRTLIELDSTGHLQEYYRVFDLEQYKKNRHKILQEAYINVREGDEMQMDTFDFINKQLSVIDKIVLSLRIFYRKIRNLSLTSQ